MNQTINFIANTNDFKSVKKMKIIPGVKDLDILEFLISIEVTSNFQINKYLGKIINLTSFNLEISKLFSKDPSFFIKEINLSNFSKIVEKSLNVEYKGNLKEVLDSLKSYTFNKYMLENNIMAENAVGYYKILFPTRKKQLKKIILK